ncbi:hypothetical protein B0H16DRAFT_1482038 [Mycena metata]|uniref:Uncharacterized protein n=1 Tax=Mycena metata TaxID=1033252 RepID=A0AAD7GUW3_9AGAR|nr:hypothetical protein B0H16DRAFT_1482038 [Mycena metata]
MKTSSDATSVSAHPTQITSSDQDQPTTPQRAPLICDVEDKLQQGDPASLDGKRQPDQAAPTQQLFDEVAGRRHTHSLYRTISLLSSHRITMARTKEVAIHWRNTPAGVRKLKPWPFARMQVTPIRRRVRPHPRSLQADSESDESASSGTSRQVGTNNTRRTARSGHPKNLRQPVPTRTRVPRKPAEKPNPYSFLDELTIEPVSYYATSYDCNGIRIAHTFVGADGNNDVVVAQPVRGPRVFVGAIPPEWHLGPHPVVHIDPALQEKSATKSRSGRFFIGNEKMLTHRPPPNIYPINTDAAYNSAPSPAPMQPPSPMSDITASPLPLSPLTRPSTPKSPDSAEHSRSKLPSPTSDTTGSPRPLSPLTLPSTPKSPDSAEHARSNSTGYGIAVDSSDVKDYSRIAPQAEAICPDSCEKRADDVPIFTDESIGLDLLLFRASTPDGLPVSSLPVGLYGDSLPHHSILNLSPAPNGIDVDGASSTGPSLQASDEDLSQRLHTLRIFSPSPSPSFEISESIDDAAVFSPSPSPSFEISESIDDAAQEPDRSKLRLLNQCIRYQLVSALGMLVYASDQFPDSRIRTIIIGAIHHCERALQSMPPFEELDEHFPFGMLQSAETDFHSCVLKFDGVPPTTVKRVTEDARAALLHAKSIIHGTLRQASLYHHLHRPVQSSKMDNNVWDPDRLGEQVKSALENTVAIGEWFSLPTLIPHGSQTPKKCERCMKSRKRNCGTISTFARCTDCHANKVQCSFPDLYLFFVLRSQHPGSDLELYTDIKTARSSARVKSSSIPKAKSALEPSAAIASVEPSNGVITVALPPAGPSVIYSQSLTRSISPPLKANKPLTKPAVNTAVPPLPVAPDGIPPVAPHFQDSIAQEEHPLYSLCPPVTPDGIPLVAPLQDGIAQEEHPLYSLCRIQQNEINRLNGRLFNVHLLQVGFNSVVDSVVNSVNKARYHAAENLYEFKAELLHQGRPLTGETQRCLDVVSKTESLLSQLLFEVHAATAN